MTANRSNGELSFSSLFMPSWIVVACARTVEDTCYRTLDAGTDAGTSAASGYCSKAWPVTDFRNSKLGFQTLELQNQ